MSATADSLHGKVMQFSSYFMPIEDFLAGTAGKDVMLRSFEISFNEKLKLQSEIWDAQTVLSDLERKMKDAEVRNNAASQLLQKECGMSHIELRNLQDKLRLKVPS